MRLPRVSIFILLFTLLIGITFSQETDESPAPKRVLKKYRVRRPVIVDDQGNVVRAGPRLRRVRVKNPKFKVETSSQAPIVSVVTSTSNSDAPSVSSTISPTPQIVRQRIRQNAIPLERQVQPQTVLFEEQGVVEPIRTVPITYRQATPQASRDALLASAKYKPSNRGTGGGTEDDRKVGTVRNYQKINDDGSFTFGYEAEDGSFKEENRGVDCVVRGKYGYIDPEGVRREFEYVSGNPCDPNNPDKEEQSDEEEDGLSKPPIRQRVRPTEISENNIQQGFQQVVEERVPEDQLANYYRPAYRQRIRPTQSSIPPQGLVLRQRVRITTPPPSLATNQVEQEPQPAYVIRQRPFSIQSPRPTVYQDVSQSLDDNRPTGGQGLFNFDQEVHRLAAISRPQTQPQPLYEQPFRQVFHQPHPAGRQIFGNAAFRQEQATATPPTTLAASPSPTPTGTPNSAITNPAFGRYRSELVYDPNSGQYTSVLVQANPNSNQEFELTQRLRAFAPTPSTPSPSPSPGPSPSAPTPSHFTTPTPSSAYTQIQQFGQPQIQYYHTGPGVQQGRSANPTPSQAQGQPINQYLARHAYQFQPQAQAQTQTQPQQTVNNLQFIPPHLRPGANQLAEIEKQDVLEVKFPSQGFSANSASASNGQIDAFLRALNIQI